MTHRAACRAAAALCLLLALPPGLARAAAPAAAPAHGTPSGAAAKPPAIEGQSYYDLLRYDDAIALLADMVERGTAPPDQLMRAREVLARCYVKKGYPVLAKDMFKANLRAQPSYRPSPIHVPPDEWVVFEQAQKEVLAEEGADSLAGGRASDAAPGGAASATAVIEVRAKPYASFYVDGRLEAHDLAFARLEVSPGRHRVKIVHPAFEPREWTTEAAAGSVTRLSHDFLGGSTGSVRVSSAGIWAEVYIDGVNTGAITPCVVPGLKPGRHSITVERARFTAGTPLSVTVEPGEVAVARFRLRSSKAEPAPKPAR